MTSSRMGTTIHAVTDRERKKDRTQRLIDAVGTPLTAGYNFSPSIFMDERLSDPYHMTAVVLRSIPIQY